MGGSLSFIFIEKIKAGYFCTTWLISEGILAETVLPPRAPVDIIYTLIQSSHLLPGQLPLLS